MQSVATRATVLRPRNLPKVAGSNLGRIDSHALGIWVLAGGLVLYLGIDGGGYDSVVHSRVGLLVWWIVLLGAVSGLLPASRLTRSGWAVLALFAGFVGWTALASTWSLSSERSLSDLSLVAGYLGVLVLAVSLERDRDSALRHTMSAIAAAIVVVAALALLARLRPDLFPAAQQTAAYLPDSQRRLGWPLNYWNALAALMAFGVPLLLGLSTSARTLPRQAAAAAGIPIVLMCAYLTFSRGGAIAVASAAAAFTALAPERLPKIATALAGAAGGAVLILGAAQRSAIEHGLANGAARREGAALLFTIVFVCAGVALVQAGIGLAIRHGTPPRLLAIPRRQAQRLLLGAVVAFVIVALPAGIPGDISHAWRTFKNSNAAALGNDSIARFGTLSGNGRYDYWKRAVNSTGNHVVGGSGPGTFQLLWLPHSPPNFSYIQNAHSLYFETLAETGVVGLALLVGFFGLVLTRAIRLVTTTRFEHRTRAAGAAAALVAFAISAASDWIWQVPVLPVAFLLLAAAVLAPHSQPAALEYAPTTRRVFRAVAVVTALACLAAIAVPLAETLDLRSSQVAATSGNLGLALHDARNAAGWEPRAATPQIQLALVQETQGDLRGALVSARRAAHDEPGNWSTWLILARLDAEANNPVAAVSAYGRARSLNPASPLFSNL
jgi:O-Antigen ligase